MKIQRGVWLKRCLWGGFSLAVIASLVSTLWFQQRYRTEEVMEIPVTEFSNSQYPEDPANRSIHYGRYANRKVRLERKDDTHFDFVFEPTNAHTAKVIFKNVDVALFVPIAPEWTKTDSNLEKIAFVDREWNRQQVSFKPNSEHVEVRGGNGFEKGNLYSAEIARNCLNAGLWEVLLFTQEDGQKALYYQGWFTFPLGHYKRIFEKQNQISYWRHWWRLEHWVDPVGTPIPMEKLRTVLSEEDIKAEFRANESILATGEQRRKARTVEAKNLVVWRDIIQGDDIKFAAFIPPGRYSLQHLRTNEYWRLNTFQKASLRKVQPRASARELYEIELVFEPRGKKDLTRFIVSGIDINAIPQLSEAESSKGLYMPMGIGVPPFFQSYEDLERSPSFKGPYFSVMLDAKGRWLNHHDVAIDGPVIRRDDKDPNRLHICLLSYERHLLVGHFIADIGKKAETSPVATKLGSKIPQG